MQEGSGSMVELAGSVFAALRTEYSRVGIDIDDLDPDPFRQFARWFEVATGAGVSEPNAMTVATASADGMPSARTVLLKGVDPRGFVFYTNYGSQKGDDLAANPRAALLFFWKELHRQVRVSGTVERVSPEETAAYFQSRPRGSQIGSAASPQSRVIPDRASLEARVADLEREVGEAAVPTPDSWGGYRVRPLLFEFWQGRENRLHDRIRYVPAAAPGIWRRERLAP